MPESNDVKWPIAAEAVSDDQATRGNRAVLSADDGVPDTLSNPPGSVIQLREPEGSSPPIAAMPAALAGRYQLLGEIGRGGMGAVLRGRDPELGRDLALKVLLQEVAERPEVVQRFREEAQIGGQLQHPGVVPVYELGHFDDGRPFFTMKLVKGVTLAKLLKERATSAQDRPRFLKIFEQICQAVAFAHSRGVIHRDLKPSNVMVGAFGEVQVMDWGLAKVLHPDPAAERVQPTRRETGDMAPSIVKVSRTDSGGGETREGDVLGTPAYMPPEQALGEINHLDERCDVFSLGAILCEVLTGKPPYTGAGSMEVLRLARRAELGEALARLDACEADAELIGLTRRCLSAGPAGRPGNAEEVAKAIEAYLSSVEERVRQAELERAAAEARATAERRSRRLTLGLAVSVLLLVVGGGGSAWLVQHEWAESAARKREANQAVQVALDRAHTMLEEGWQTNDSGKLAAAESEADKAFKIACTGGASEEFHARADALVLEVQAKRNEAKKNGTLLAALLDVSTPRETKEYARTESGRMAAMVGPSVDEQFAAAFRRWGVDVDRESLNDAAARLQSQPPGFVQEVLAGLEAWMLERRRNRPEVEWRRLLRLADRLDNSERRREVRRLLVGDQLQGERIAGELTKLLLPWSIVCGPIPGESRLKLERLASAMAPEREPVLGVVTLARVLVKAGGQREAESLLRASLAVRPDQVVLLNALGTMLSEQRRSGEAIECYRAARALRPTLGNALSEALRQAGRAAEAEAILRDQVRQQPDNPERYVRLSGPLLDQKKLDEAMAACRKAIELQPDCFSAFVNLGIVLGHQKKLDEEMAAYRKASELQPDSATPYYNLGNVLRNQKKLDEAMAAYRKAIELQPDLFPAYYNLGSLLRGRKRLDEAVAAYRKAIELQPDYSLAYICLGIALESQRKLDEAVTTYRKAIELQPNYALAHGYLGNALREQKRLDEAVVAHRRAIALQPNDAQAYFNLGVDLRGQKKLDEALVALRKAAQLLPNNDFLRLNLRRTEALLESNRRLPDVLAGKTKAAGPREQLELARFCSYYHENSHAAVAFYGDAFLADPKLADDLHAGDRYDAACAAALAASDKGAEGANLDEMKRIHLRRQALDWLLAELVGFSDLAENSPAERQWVQQRLAHWQEDTDLTSLRDEKSLASLPEMERAAWQHLWADVAALRKKVATRE